jgi:hypothetical protein
VFPKERRVEPAEGKYQYENHRKGHGNGFKVAHQTCFEGEIADVEAIYNDRGYYPQQKKVACQAQSQKVCCLVEIRFQYVPYHIAIYDNVKVVHEICRQ